MKVGAVDPALSNFGMTKGIYDTVTNKLVLKDLALVSTEKTDVPPKNFDDLRRAKILYNGVTEYLSKVDVIFVEMPYASQSARASVSYGICVGLFAAVKTPLILTTARSSKILLAGSPKATKKQMIDACKELYPNLNWTGAVTRDEHLADAIGAALAGINTPQFNDFIGKLNATDNHPTR